ncbi:hypothetical protein [Chondromyces crocatus]|uniref:Cytochrome P460 domain-containing protein n=1 Tax=Chondromyces crocatus TaxID=52 RepID=A0A0K1EMJ0_CHOCO|nr:hypothetical protein [Chondromyces crocatus]AKT41853.1 uncharacterized protein CMC5_060650 [Chondromyces crocatus]
MSSRAALASSLVLLLACSASSPSPLQRSEGEWLSASDPTTAPDGVIPQAFIASESSTEAWEHAREALSFSAVSPRRRSQHFAGNLEGVISVNAKAEGYPRLGPALRLPPGSILVEAHYDAAAQDPTTFLAMEKRAPGYDPGFGDWEYFILSSTGEVAARGKLLACRRCHAEAPHDGVFGVWQ